jgi:hypothetical protein
VVADPGATWRITDHACRQCFGRVLSRATADATVYRCSNCGLQLTSTRPESICACGTTLRTGKNAGLRCLVNTSPTPECPAEIIVEEVAGPPKRP